MRTKLTSPLLFCLTIAFSPLLFSQVNGYNATVVEYPSGSFRQLSDGIWREYTTTNGQFNFNETQRDEWSIYLLDPSRNISIQLDLYRKEIFMDWEKPTRVKLYNIVNSATNTPITSPDPGPPGYTKIADENGGYDFNTPVDVAFGAYNKFSYKYGIRGVVHFNTATFGDPIPGVAKSGYYKQSTVVRTDPANPVDPTFPVSEINPIAASDMQLILKWIADEVADANIAYCYKNSYTRDLGQSLSGCPPGTEKDGLLCYPPCRQGYKGVGPVCWQNCPGNFHDTGGHCLKPEAYGRGGGYPWKFGDGLNLDNAMKRCIADNPQGCEKSGEIIYPKCRPGYKAFGCCVCSPICPDGMTDIGVSCQKLSYGRTAGQPMICPPGLEQNGALCYTPCKAGYYGAGPVCWKSCTANQPVDCAAGCAKSTTDCVEKTVNQITAVGELAANIISLGSTSKLTAAKTSLKTAIKAGDRVASKAALKQTVNAFAEGFEHLTTRKVADKLKRDFAETSAKWVQEEYAKVQLKLAMQEEFSAEDLRDLAGLDPTGVAQVIESFWQPICAKENPFPTLSRNYK